MPNAGSFPENPAASSVSLNHSEKNKKSQCGRHWGKIMFRNRSRTILVGVYPIVAHFSPINSIKGEMG